MHCSLTSSSFMVPLHSQASLQMAKLQIDRFRSYLNQNL
jgi:hypothetical protein